RQPESKFAELKNWSAYQDREGQCEMRYADEGVTSRDSEDLANCLLGMLERHVLEDLGAEQRIESIVRERHLRHASDVVGPERGVKVVRCDVDTALPETVRHDTASHADLENILRSYFVDVLKDPVVGDPLIPVVVTGGVIPLADLDNRRPGFPRL